MKKFFTCFLILILAFSLSSCSSDKEEGEKELQQLLNPLTIYMSIDYDSDSLEIDDFPRIESEEYFCEEGMTALEVTQLYCLSKDFSISTDSKDTYVTEICGFTEKDYNENTGWIFKVNGQLGNLGANEQIINDGDSISWEFVDYSTYQW